MLNGNFAYFCSSTEDMNKVQEYIALTSNKCLGKIGYNELLQLRFEQSPSQIFPQPILLNSSSQILFCNSSLTYVYIVLQLLPFCIKYCVMIHVYMLKADFSISGEREITRIGVTFNCLSIGTLKTINFPFISNGKLIDFRSPNI